MTDTDNKDPQITPEVVQEWLYGVLHEHKVVSNITDIQLARAFLHQAAELQQLRAERAGLERDALRFRYLNDKHSFYCGECYSDPAPREFGISWIYQDNTTDRPTPEQQLDKEVAVWTEENMEESKLTDAAPSNNGWQDISTAPRDKKLLLLDEGEYETIGKWYDYDYSDTPHKIKPANKYTGWLDDCGNTIKPTHWTLLPDKLTDSAQRGEGE